MSGSEKMVEDSKMETKKQKIMLAPSILSADFANLGESVKAIKDADYVHIDIMDGSFVPNISFGAAVMKSVRSLTDQVFDVHLMIEEPIRYLEDFKNAGADMICVHAEACKHLDRTVQAIKELGLKAAVALNPATSLEQVRYVLEQLDMLLVMTVNPGFGGQSLIPAMLPKIKAAADMIVEYGLQEQVRLEVDGGITVANVNQVIAAGANVIVAGSAVYKGEPQENIKAFKAQFVK